MAKNYETFDDVPGPETAVEQEWAVNGARMVIAALREELDENFDLRLTIGRSGHHLIHELLEAMELGMKDAITLDTISGLGVTSDFIH